MIVVDVKRVVAGAPWSSCRKDKSRGRRHFRPAICSSLTVHQRLLPAVGRHSTEQSTDRPRRSIHTTILSDCLGASQPTWNNLSHPMVPYWLILVAWSGRRRVFQAFDPLFLLWWVSPVTIVLRGIIDLLCLAYHATRRVLARTCRLLLSCLCCRTMLLEEKSCRAMSFEFFALSGASWWDDKGVTGLLINAIVLQLIGADWGHVIVGKGGESWFDGLGTFVTGHRRECVLKLLEPTNDT